MVLIYGEEIKKWSCFFRECKAKCCESGRELTYGDVERISKALNIAKESFLESIEDEKGIFRLKSREEKCIFLEKDYTCKLHALNAKPILCRMYPFRFNGIIYADEAILKIKIMKACPYLGKGEEITEEFEKKIEELGNQFVKELEEYLKKKHENRG